MNAGHRFSPTVELLPVPLEKFSELALVLARFAPLFRLPVIARRGSSLLQLFLFVIFFAAIHNVTLPRKFKPITRPAFVRTDTDTSWLSYWIRFVLYFMFGPLSES